MESSFESASSCYGCVQYRVTNKAGKEMLEMRSRKCFEHSASCDFSGPVKCLQHNLICASILQPNRAGQAERSRQFDKYLHFRISPSSSCCFWCACFGLHPALSTAADMLIGLDIQTLALKCRRLALAAHVLLFSQAVSCMQERPAKWP